MQFLPTIGTSLSGKLGGIVASHNRSSAYFRQRGVPVNPNTDPQVAVRGRLADAMIAWMAASSLTRTRWATYAANVSRVNRIGQSVFLTGQNWYTGYFSLASQAGKVPNSTVPAVYNRGASGITAVDWDIGSPDEVEVTYSAATATWESSALGALLVYVTAPYAFTRDFRPVPFQFLVAVPGAAVAPTSPLTITLPGELQPGERQSLRFVALSNDNRYTSGEEFVIDG